MNQLDVIAIRTNKLIITNEPIIYYWWFKYKCLNELLDKLIGVFPLDRLETKEIHNDKYALLYIGQAKKGHERLVKYHILDSSNFHFSGVENGRLSSLRTTLCGLLNLPMSNSKSEINNFMDENCIVEWEVYTIEDLNRNEKGMIQSKYLPLNYQHTKGVLSKEHREILRKSKREMRK